MLPPNIKGNISTVHKKQTIKSLPQDFVHAIATTLDTEAYRDGVSSCDVLVQLDFEQANQS